MARRTEHRNPKSAKHLQTVTRKKQKNLPAKISTDWPIMSQAVKHLFASAPLLHWEKLTSKPV